MQTVVTRFRMKHKLASCLHFTSKCKDWYLHPFGLFADRWATVNKKSVFHGVHLFSFYLSTPMYSFIEAHFYDTLVRETLTNEETS